MPTKKTWTVCAGLWIASLIRMALPVHAQTAEIKEKPPVYTFVSFWDIARAQWPDMEKLYAEDEQILSKDLASGSLVGYGHDTNLVHQTQGATHDIWWSSTSMAGVLNVIEQNRKAGLTQQPVQFNARAHSDMVFVSRYYNWHPGSWKDVYSHGASYKLKENASDDAVEMLSKSILVPFLEKQLAEGTVLEYDIDTEAIHTQDPGLFWVFYIAPNGEAIDKMNKALGDLLKANPTVNPTFESQVDFTAHRDFLSRTTATFK